MELDIAKMTENYSERIRRIGLFSFLFALQGKQQKDNDGKKIDYFGFGLLALLFFFENMLMRCNKVSIMDLSAFYSEKAGGQYNLTYEQYLKIAETIISTFRPTSGVRPDFTFFDWEHGCKETATYSILKRSAADLNINTQYYTLDEDGLALIFATKEYFSEFQISINQLLLRKQLDKGEFAGALRQIDEMYVEVLALKERMIKIKQDIQRNIVSDETYNRYKTITGDIGARLKRENLEFSELMAYVKDLQGRFSVDVELLNDKDRQSYYLINKIDVELDKVHFEHKKLLDESFLLEKSALQAARESIYFAGVEAFNFNQEVTNMIFSLPIPAEEVRILCSPFLFLQRAKDFNLLRIFAEQRLETTREVITDTFAEPMNDKEYIDYLRIASIRFERFMSLVLSYMEGRKEIELGEIIAKAAARNTEILDDRGFFDMFIVLHQKSPLRIGYTGDEKMAALFSGIQKALYQYKSITVAEKTDILEIKNKRIQNMLLTLE